MTEVWIIDAVRTPRGEGKPGKGPLCGLHPQELAATVLRALAERNDFTTSGLDDLVWSTNMQVGRQSADLGRMAALHAGYDFHCSGVTLDRFCGGGITAVNMASASIMSGMEDLLVAGGSEMMSYTAELTRTAPPMLDAGNLLLRNKVPQSHQGVCADAIAAIEGIRREELDALALESQRRAAVAIREGRFSRSLVPVHDAKGKLLLAEDSHPRPQTTAADLASLKPAFAAIADMELADGGTFRSLIHQVYPDLFWEPVHHAGNSSGVVDGAAALLLASPAYAGAHGLRPRAKVLAYANVGDSPVLMLNAPAKAARKVLKRAGLTIADIDLWEINEAFAVVAEKFQRDLDLDREKVNVNGGAIALGHPIGATGAMLIGTILDELERQDLQRGLVTMCTAGGMAPAIIIERL